MKRLPILLLVGLTLAAPPAFAEELGAFFTKVNTYTYPNGPGAGKRVLIRARQVFAIVNLTTDESNRLWYQILEPRKMRQIRGEGWTPLAPHDVPIQVHDDHAVVTGKLMVESLSTGIQLLPLQISGVSIRRVTMGEKSAALIRGPNQSIQLVLDQLGSQQVDLQMELPVQHSAAQQSLGFQLPSTAATKITMTVPGNIELKSGASVLSRRIDEQGLVFQPFYLRIIC
ncbi:MAG: hypothetical protein IIA14_12725 [SAR324 cluster bacterium]|nr:hypothetical protein [SAR324 cluster bacterium]